MADLIAQGVDPSQRWRRALPEGETILLGRQGTWAVAWDQAVSRRHAELRWRRGKLAVTRLPESANAIFHRGRAREQFEAAPGEHFVIGHTTFTVADDKAAVTLDAPAPEVEQSYSSQSLQRVRYRHAEQRIEALNRLPELIAGAASDADLCSRLVNGLLAGVANATAAAIVRCDAPEDAAPVCRIDVLHWDRRLVATGRDFEPSQRLIQAAVQRQETVLHVWKSDQQASADGPEFTIRNEADWAFCTPVVGEASPGWALYVEGRFADAGNRSLGPADLREDLKFAELAATTLAALRDNRMLEQRQAGLRQFFSPVVLDALRGESPEQALAPREADVSVLFCDLRGFSRASEQGAEDLLGLLERVSKALGVTTRHILDEGGVVGDFQGDAAMGFWGWPFEQADRVQRACSAALAIRAEFAASSARPGHPLAQFQMGIGIASGRAVAGKIGTADQVKVSVFGPVVNLASRLEGMTKLLRAPIIIDEATARVVRQRAAPQLARVRRLARVRPYGLETSHEVSELLPSAEELPTLADEHLIHYEAALDALIAGDWEAAFERLHHVPADDRVKDFLTGFIAQHHRRPPRDWTGVIELESK